MDLRVKGSPKYTEQSLKLKLNLYKARTLTIENDDEYTTTTTGAKTLYKLSGVGGKELSNLQNSFQEWVDLFRDYPGLGVDLNYHEIFQLQERIEREESLKKFINQQDPSSVDAMQYEQILAVLVEKFNKKYEAKDAYDPNNDQNKEFFKSQSMPKVITHLEIGKGHYARAILCTKANRNEKFNLERDIVKDQTTGEILNRYYVVKDIKKDDCFIAKAFKPRLDYEAYLSVWMRHPNVVQVLGCYDSLDYRKYIMEFLPFTDVLRILKMHTFNDLSIITAQIVLALEYIHEIGFVFADLHTGNVCMDYRGYIKLIDFGVSVHKDDKILQIAYGITVRNLDENHLCLTESAYRYCYDVHRLGMFVEDLMIYNIASLNAAAATSVTVNDVYLFINKHQYQPGDQHFLPTMRQSRDYSLFKNIDFKRLLLREYDMTSAYSTPLSELFALNKHQSMSINRKNTFRDNQTRFGKYRKLDDPSYAKDQELTSYELPKNLK